MQSFLVRAVAVIAGQQIALVGDFAGQGVAVEALLPGDVVDGLEIEEILLHVLG
jgi:hypothetical protein|nr:hypothetical protein [Mitsuokella multacida]